MNYTLFTDKKTAIKYMAWMYGVRLGYKKFKALIPKCALYPLPKTNYLDCRTLEQVNDFKLLVSNAAQRFEKQPYMPIFHTEKI